MPNEIPSKVFQKKRHVKVRRLSKKKYQRKKVVSLPHWGSNLQCLALKSSALSITPQERLIALKPIFLLFMFIALIFKSIYAPVCLFVWKTLSGVRLGMEPSTKYQKHSPGIILSATLTLTQKNENLSCRLCCEIPEVLSDFVNHRWRQAAIVQFTFKAPFLFNFIADCKHMQIKLKWSLKTIRMS